MVYKDGDSRSPKLQPSRTSQKRVQVISAQGTQEKALSKTIKNPIPEVGQPVQMQKRETRHSAVTMDNSK